MPETTHLILLVGTNPLPVYVSGGMLCDGFSPRVEHVTLVHTGDQPGRGTHDAARAVGRTLDFASTSYCETHAGDSTEIVRTLQQHLERSAKHSRVHLNYTGGTKAMAVHAAEAMLNFADARKGADQPKLSYSYLDPRGPRGPELVDSEPQFKGQDPREKVRLPLAEIVKLHGLVVGPYDKIEATPSVRVEPPETDPPVELARAIRAAYANWENDLTVQKQRAAYQGRDQSLKVLLGKAAVSSSFSDYLVELEVFDLIRQLTSTFSGKMEILHSVRAGRPEPGGRSGAVPQVKRDFEIDVVAVYGHQVLALSCTSVAPPGEVKHKGFEVLHRVRQMGGDEAHAAVICGSDPRRAQLVEDELHDDIGGDSRPLRIFPNNGSLRSALRGYLRDELHWPVR